jgi:hypothetical protein
LGAEEAKLLEGDLYESKGFFANLSANPKL